MGLMGAGPYAQIVSERIVGIGLQTGPCGTHPRRRTEASEKRTIRKTMVKRDDDETAPLTKSRSNAMSAATAMDFRRAIRPNRPRKGR